MVFPRRLLNTKNCPTGQVNLLADGARQIALKVLACPIGGENRVLEVLIDTGAQINVVRRGLFSEHDMRPSKTPLRLTLADGQPFWGGDRELRARLTFGRTINHVVQPWRARANFYEGEIRADMILGLPWLAENGLDVLTREACLAMRVGWKLYPIGDAPDVSQDSSEEGPLIDTTPCRVATCHATPRHFPWSKPKPHEPCPPLSSMSRLEAHGPKNSCQTRKVMALDECDGMDDALVQTEDIPHYPFVVPSELHMESDNDFLSDKEKWDMVRDGLWPENEGAEVGGIYVSADRKVESTLAEELRKKILDEFADTVFRPQIYADPPERIPGGIHTIKLKDGAQPHYQAPFRLTGERRQAMEEIVQKWVDVGKIERPTRNEGWGAAVFPIPKKNGEYRGITDQRGLNERVLRDNYPLPLIEGILERKGRCRMFSKLDLKDAFSQVPLAPECRHLTTINTPLGPYQWKVLPQGYCNAPSFFQRVMDMVYYPVRDVIDNYIDDGIVGTDYGDTEEEELWHHYHHLRRVCEVLKENKLVLDPAKCQFFMRQVEFCGHVLENGTKRPAPGKLLSVERWPPPTNVTQMRAFLGFANYYSSYVRDFAKYAAPLMDKLKVGRKLGKKGSTHPVYLSPEDLEAFNSLKKELTSGLSLQAINPDAPFVLRVDASERAIGAVLEQLPDAKKDISPEEATSGKTVPVAFLSRKLTPGQAAKWSVKEKEAYAIVSALKKWASWIGLQPLLVLSDHKSLEEWSHEVLDTPTGPTGRQARWHMLLSHFKVTVGYVPGKDNSIPDIMSRWAYPASDATCDISVHGSPEDDEAMKKMIEIEKANEKECRVVSISWPTGMLDMCKNSGKVVAILTEVRRPRVLDLFSGTGSWSAPFAELGWEVITLDHNPRFRPTICANILEWNPHEFPPGYFDVILASPPCHAFSRANQKRPHGLHFGDCYVLQALRIIEYFQPSMWMLENPRTGDLVHRTYMKNIPYADFDYCEFSEWGYKKPTRIWGSSQISQVPSVLCKGTCHNMAKPVEGQRPRHKQWLGAYGPQPSLVEKYRIPKNLVRYLMENLGNEPLTQKEHGSSSFSVMCNTLRVLTRSGRATSEGSESDEAPPALHPSRSTLGRKKNAQKEGVHENPTPVEVKREEDDDIDDEDEEEEEEDAFFTPPESPRHDEGMQGILPTPPLQAPMEVKHDRADSSHAPPPQEPPMRFYFKAHGPPSQDVAQAPRAPSPSRPSGDGAPAPHARRERVDESGAIPPEAAHHQESLASDPGRIFDLDWAPWYKKCSKWWEPWTQIEDGEEWPKGYQLLDGKLFLDSKLCVPLGMTRDVVRAHHSAVGHIGGKRLLAQMARFYNWASEERVGRYARLMQKECVLCQAMEHPHHSLKLRQDPIPIPPAIMDSVAIDVFTMPPVVFENATYDCFVACVDRLSGWIIAFPATRKGLRADVVAKQMFHRAWSLFGVPRIITSDQGPQFAAAWWQTLCGCLGIRQAFAQAYHSQANGRAEVAGRELQRKLRFLRETSPTLPWVEALPVAVQHINDSPGESGLSPYEILTGRVRNLPGVPIPVPREAQDALDFLEHQKDVELKVAEIMNSKHEKVAAKLEEKRNEPMEFSVGDIVWYKRPPSMTADKALPRWVGPCPIMARSGMRSYQIEVKPGIWQLAHRSQLKPFVSNDPQGESFPLHYFRLTPEEQAPGEGEWNVEKIIKHKETAKGPMFLTKWEGFPISEATWEPINHFFHRYAAPFVTYCREHGMDHVDVLPHLSQNLRMM